MMLITLENRPGQNPNVVGIRHLIFQDIHQPVPDLFLFDDMDTNASDMLH